MNSRRGVSRQEAQRCAEHIKNEFPTVRGLILSMHPEELVALRALRAGAPGYVQKEAAEDDLIVAIRTIAAWETTSDPGEENCGRDGAGQRHDASARAFVGLEKTGLHTNAAIVHYVTTNALL